MKLFQNLKSGKSWLKTKQVENLRNLGLTMAQSFVAKSLMNSVQRMAYPGIEHVVKPLNKMELLKG